MVLVAEYLGYELQVGEVDEIDADVISSIRLIWPVSTELFPSILSEGGIHFLAADPFNSAIIDDLTFALNLEIQLIVAEPDYVNQLLTIIIRLRKILWMICLGNVGLENFEGLDESKENELSDAANETPIIRFVNLVMQQAIRAQGFRYSF